MILKKSEGPLALFETQPPGIYEEWRVLEGQMKANQLAFEPGDFTSMLRLLDGTELQIQGGRCRDFRITAEGFRFILSLQPGFVKEGPDWLSHKGLSSGDYLVTYVKGAFQVIPLIPPQLSLMITNQLINLTSDNRVYTTNLLVTNQGNQDSEDLEVVLVADCGGNFENRELIRSSVLVLGDSEAKLSTAWQPPLDQDCQLSATLTTMDGTLIDQVSYPFKASMATERLFLKSLATSTRYYQRIPAFALFGLLGILGGIILYFIKHTSQADIER